jgi:hypothetical protein
MTNTTESFSFDRRLHGGRIVPIVVDTYRLCDTHAWGGSASCSEHFARCGAPRHFHAEQRLVILLKTFYLSEKQSTAKMGPKREFAVPELGFRHHSIHRR